MGKMSVSVYVKDFYEDFGALRLPKNKANCKVHSSWFIARTKKGWLKKQTQFIVGQIGVNSYMKGIYDNIPPLGARKNKANLSLQ